MDAPFRLVTGFVAGDCLTLLAWALVVMLPFLRPRFEGAADFETASVISIGDGPVLLWPSWASRAGEVRGLKKSSALPYSGKLNAPVNGVCAGETRGVKEAWKA